MTPDLHRAHPAAVPSAMSESELHGLLELAERATPGLFIQDVFEEFMDWFASRPVPAAKRDRRRK